MQEHARLSPSSAHRWMHCPGSLALEESLPKKGGDTGSEFSREGTAAHELAQWALTEDKDCADYIGRFTANGWEITRAMAEDVQVYVDRIHDYAEGNTLFVEQRIDFSEVVNVPDSFGTGDAVIITSDSRELQIHDLKFGRGVQVFAEWNEQLIIYALGELHKYSLIHDFDRVRLVIHQPRLNHLSEWDITPEELVEFSTKLRLAAKEAIHYAANGNEKGWPKDLHFNPGEKQCRWCKAAALCPALSEEVRKTVGDDFDYVTDTSVEPPASFPPQILATKMNAIDLIESWCKAVRAEVERHLIAGTEVSGYKLVQGKQGNRAWTDEKEVETHFKSMRLTLEEMYDFKLISPTAAEKQFKDTPRKWKKIQEFITRAPGKPSVAPVSDKRPPLAPVSDDFAPVHSPAS